jgi:hypothetical protein
MAMVGNYPQIPNGLYLKQPVIDEDEEWRQQDNTTFQIKVNDILEDEFVRIREVYPCEELE